MDEIELLASAFESSLDAKLVIFSNGKIYRANRAAEKIFLRPSISVLEERNILSLVSGKTKVALKDFLSSLKEVGQLHEELELKIDGDNRVFDITANAFIMSNLHLLTLRDITDKVRDKETREKFIAIAGHELKTPLAVISAYTDLLKRKYKDDPVMAVYLNKISNKNKVLTHYIDSILDEIRIGAGKLSFDDKKYKFGAIVKEPVEELKRAYPQAKIVHRGRADSLVNVDKERIAQVVRNLIVNAIKHSPRGKKIFVDIDTKENSVYFSVKNSGKGIPKKEQNAIFQAFYRSKKVTKGSGLGLGLYISKQILNQYRGIIGVESQKGKGAKFFFEIPVFKESLT